MAEMVMDGWDDRSMADLFGDNPDILKLGVFLVDHSGSYEGTMIGKANSFIEEIIPEIEDRSARLAIMEIDRNVVWQTPKPVDVESASLSRVKAGSYSELGKAFVELARKLADSNWCPSGQKGTNGLFVLFSDGLSTDDYRAGLEKLKKSPLFAKGTRIVLNLSDLANPEVLKAFADSPAHIYDSGKKEQAAKAIRDFFNNRRK